MGSSPRQAQQKLPEPPILPTLGHVMSTNEMPKAYEPAAHEDGVYAAWEASGYFNPDKLPGQRKEAFTVVLPPPNVTGTLHMGHAVMLAVEDTMVRFARLRGKKALWIPGTDHAAIATQTKVEKLLMKEGMKDPRGELGREAFLERVQAFASASHDTIVNQCKKLGASLDWSREAYTLDVVRTKAVRAAFTKMYNDGLIYRGYRVVNWCARCQSTLADDEVQYREETSKFYYLKYGPIVIGTARPETKFHDKVIVVHPEDERYTNIVGKTFEVEWIEGKVSATVIADKEADMTFGTGAMTITPAHSHEDFAIAQAHGLEIIPIIDEHGVFTSAAGSFTGRSARESRDEIVATLAGKGLVERIDEKYVHNLSVCYRCDSPVEPLPKLQWFINVNKTFKFQASLRAPIHGIADGQEVTLKSVMQQVVREGEIKIVPDRFEKTYFHWIDHLRDWNISRQIWFGHRVPVWYRGEETFVGIEAPEGEGWTQDPDTLDTWFSSGLWTLSTLGWPEETLDLRTFHPTSVLETGYDILFFWIARMVLMTTYCVGEVPFKTVYLHGLVRDEQGRKMSKSLDNIIDPLDMIAKYGADATRLSLVIGNTPGNDSRLSEEKVAAYRNFTNKLWNIARFVLTTIGSQEGEVRRSSGSQDPVAATLVDRWILSRLGVVTERVTRHLDTLEFSAAGEVLRDFTWSEFADWYLEAAKTQPGASTNTILLFALERLLILWHPFMPFVTEVIWKELGKDSALIVAEWPVPSEASDAEAERDFALVRDLIVATRNLRSTYRVEPALFVTVAISTNEAEAMLTAQSDLLKRLARIETLTIAASVPGSEDFASAVVGTTTVFLSLAGLVDKDAERVRLEEEITQLTNYIASVESKLANVEFTAKAPEKVVTGMRAKLAEALAKRDVIAMQLKTLTSNS